MLLLHTYPPTHCQLPLRLVTETITEMERHGGIDEEEVTI